MKHPSNKKEVQQLTGRVAALSRFISKSTERCLPFFKVLRQAKGFLWSDDCRRAIEDIKRYLASPPLLAKPKEAEVLYLYFAIFAKAVASVLVKEDEGKIQRTLYYISKVLHGAKMRYLNLEKMIYALVISTQRLRPYFQAHSVSVLSNQPLRAALQWPDTSGRIAKTSASRLLSRMHRRRTPPRRRTETAPGRNRTLLQFGRRRIRDDPHECMDSAHRWSF